MAYNLCNGSGRIQHKNAEETLSPVGPILDPSLGRKRLLMSLAFFIVCNQNSSLAQVSEGTKKSLVVAQAANRAAVSIPLFGELVKPSFSNQNASADKLNPGGAKKTVTSLVAALQEKVAETSASDPLIFSIDFMVSQISKGITNRAEGEFKSAVKYAVATHPSIKSAAMDRASSASYVDEAFAPLLPTVSGIGDFGTRNYGLNAVNSSQTRRENGFNAGLSLRQLIYDFGASRSTYNAAEAKLKQSDADFDGARADLALRAVSVYVDLLRTRSLRILAEQNRNARQELLKQISSRASDGGSSQSDVVRTESRYLDAVANLSAMASRQATAEGIFNEVFGRAAPEVLPIPTDPKTPGENRPVEELLRQFPAASAKESAMLAAQFEAESAKSRGLPSLSAQLSHTRRATPVDNSAYRGSDTTALLVFKYDFYSGGGDKARAEQAAFKAGRAAFEFDLIARQYERSLAEVRAQVKNGEEIKQARIKAAKASAASMRAINEQFRYNRGSLLDVLKTQEEVYTAGKDLIDSAADQIIAKYRLMHMVSQIDLFFGLGQIKPNLVTLKGAETDKKGITRGPLD